MNIQELFSHLDDAGRAMLEPLLVPVRFEKGETIFLAGDPGNCCYLVDAGDVRVEVGRSELDTDGVLGWVGAGHVVGEIALLDREPRSASAFAHTDVVARRIDSSALDELGRDHPRLVLSVVSALAADLAQKIRGTNERLADAIFPERDAEVEAMVLRAKEAQACLTSWSEAAIDELILAIAQNVAVNSAELATATVDATRLGNVADKTFKNQVAALGVANSLIGQTGSGEIESAVGPGVTELAAPVGVVFGLIPQTNPVATAVFKTLICLKSRNALILSFHHSALPVADRLGRILTPVLEAHGAHPDLIQWVRFRTSRKKTAAFMSHAKVGLILATGGAGMVRAAYSSGTPAIGVGPGNAPVLITASADIEHAAHSIVISKSFDNGLICGSEHNLIVESAVANLFVSELERNGAAVLTSTEAARFSAVVIDPATRAFRPEVVGQSAARIAAFTRIERPWPIQLIVVPVEWSSPDAWSGEKMAPMLSLYTVSDTAAGIQLSQRLLLHVGMGHTSILHTNDDAVVRAFSEAMPTSRVLINSPGSHGVVGYTTGLLPSFTLGCGTFGGNSTTDNVGFRNLTNIKRVARFVDPSTRGLAAPPAGAAVPRPPSAFVGL
jgi:acetaldehyde dehydrogenase/alcohol dehydrogenase